MFPRQVCRVVPAVRPAAKLANSIRLFASLTSLPSTPISIRVSKDEVSAGSLNWCNVEVVTRALHRDGLVVLEDLIKHERLDQLNEKMVGDAYALQALGDEGPFNYNKGNIQQDPPMMKKWWDPSIFVS